MNRCIWRVNEERGGKHKKQMAKMSEKRRDTATVHNKDCSGQVHQRVQNTKKHCQHASSVEANS